MGDLSKKWGLNLNCGFGWPLATSVSEGGSEYECGLSVTINPTLADRYSFDLIFPWGNTEGKLFASGSGEGQTSKNFNWSALAAMSHLNRSHPAFTKGGAHWFSLVTSTTPYIGPRRSSIAEANCSSEDFSCSTYMLDIGMKYGAGLEFMPKPRFDIGIITELTYGASFLKSGSDWNRLKLEFMIKLFVGYGDESSPLNPNEAGDLPPPPPKMEIAFAIYSALLGIPQTILMNMTLADMQKKLEDMGISLSDGDPGRTEDIRLLQSFSAFFGAWGWKSSMEQFMNLGNLNPIPLVLEIVKGGAGIVVGATQDSTASTGSGMANLLGALDMGIYMLMDVDSPADRKKHEKDVVPRLLKSDLIIFGINDLLAVIGAVLLHQNPKSDAGSIMFSAAVGANAGTAFFVGPKKSGAVVRTTAAYSPINPYQINYESGGVKKKASGMRSSIIIQKTWGWNFLFSEFAFSSHALRLDNLFKRAGAAPSEPYDDAELPSEISARLGFQKEWKHVRLGASLDILAPFGAPAGISGGIGLTAATDVFLFNKQKNGWGLMLGVRGSIATLFPHGWQWEVAFPIGLTLPSL